MYTETANPTPVLHPNEHLLYMLVISRTGKPAKKCPIDLAASRWGGVCVHRFIGTDPNECRIPTQDKSQMLAGVSGFLVQWGEDF